MSRTAHLWLRLDASRGSMSLRALAKELGCSPSSLTRWSQGKAPSAEVALAATEWIARLPPADALPAGVTMGEADNLLPGGKAAFEPLVWALARRLG